MKSTDLSTPPGDIGNETWFDKEEHARRIHFRANDRIHADHFLFVHRILETSYIARAISQKFATDIIEIYQQLEDSTKDGTLAIVGHHSYIETLLSLTKEHLEYTKAFKRIDYFIFNEKVPIETEARHLILVLPIDLTLQRTFDFRRKLVYKLGLAKHRIISTAVTVFLITNGLTLQDNEEQAEDQPESISFKKFGWKSIDHATRTIKASDRINTLTPEADAQLTIKYLYYYRVKLYNVLKCELCVPKIENYYQEEPLLTFDSHTNLPNIIFKKLTNEKLPEGRPIFSETGDKITLDAGCFISGHNKINRTCFFHWIDNRKFFTRNEANITTWLRNITEYSGEEHRSKQKFILTSDRYYRSAFIATVNRILFNNEASIINYNTRINLEENFLDFYRPMLEGFSDKLFFYADDIIDNEENFAELYTLLQFAARGLPRETDAGADIFTINEFNFAAVFTMIDRMPDWSRVEFENIPRLEKFFRFHKISIPSLRTEQLECQLCAKTNHYKSLANDSMLDFLKGYYNQKVRKVTVYEGNIFDRRRSIEQLYENKDYFLFINEGTVVNAQKKAQPDSRALDEVIKREQQILIELIHQQFDEKYLQALVTDQLSKIIISEDSLLSGEYLPGTVNINRVKRDIQERLFPVKDHSLENYEPMQYDELMRMIWSIVKANREITSITEQFPKQLSERIQKKIEKTVIKVLAFPPFSLYKNVNLFIFRYSIIELRKRLLNLNPEQDKLPNFAEFLSLKFYLNRVVLLHSNFLLRYETLNDIRKIFKDNVKISNRIALYKSAREHVSDLLEESESVWRCPLKRLSKSQGFQRQSITLTRRQGSLPVDHEEMLAYLKNRDLREITLRRLEKNLDYRISRIESFNYFVVALIKDLTYRNHSASILLEKSLNNFSSEYQNDSVNIRTEDFLYLWRLLKLENISLLASFINEVTRAASLMNSAGTRIEDEIKNHVTRIFTSIYDSGHQLKDFLEKNSPDISAKRQSLLNTTILRCILQSDKQPVDLISVVRRYFLKILALNDENCTFSLFVNVRANERVVAQIPANIYSEVNGQAKYTNVDSDGLVVNILSGISLTADGRSPQSFLELIRGNRTEEGETETYFSVRKRYFRTVKNEKVESTIDFKDFFEKDKGIGFYREPDNYFLIFRLTSSVSPNTGKALFIISDRLDSPKFLEPDYLRLLLLLRPVLNTFIDKQYANDYFWRKTELDKKNARLSSTKHGLIRYIQAFKKILETTELNFESMRKRGARRKMLKTIDARYREYNFIFDLFQKQVYKSFELSVEGDGKLRPDNKQDMSRKSVTTIMEFQKQIDLWTDYIFGSKYIGGANIHKGKYVVSFESGNVTKKEITLKFSVVYIVIPEIILNIKKRNEMELDDTEKVIIKWSFAEKEEGGKKMLEVSVENTVAKRLADVIGQKVQPVIAQGKGLYLCDEVLNGRLSIEKRNSSQTSEFSGRPSYCTTFSLELENAT